MNKKDIIESLYGHNEADLLQMYEGLVKNPKLREKNEEFIDMLADVIVEKQIQVKNILEFNQTNNA